MNAAEKSILHIAIALFAVGLVVRFLPWGIPSIEQQSEPSKQEYIADIVQASKETSLVLTDDSVDDPEITDKVIEAAGEKGSSSHKKKRKKAKKVGKIISLPVHINSAGVDELCALKGVGPKLAEKILAFREQNGPFLTPQDLQKVPGIGKKKAEGILLGVIFD